MDIKNVQERLNDFSVKHQLAMRAVDSCRKALQDFVNGQDELGGLDVMKLILEFTEQSLVFNSSVRNIPFIRTTVAIYTKGTDEQEPSVHYIGRYSLDTNLTAEVIDDWLVIDGDKAKFGSGGAKRSKKSREANAQQKYKT